MKRSRLLSAMGVAVVGLLAACSDAAPTASEEVAGELRALRLLLAQQPRAASQPAAAVDVQQALAPLRAALDALANSQRELGERQLALTQEMQRWSQLLVESVGAARGEEAKATSAKLRELEASLRSQDARHREVEAMIQGALEHTADQLDAFLKRLQVGTPPAPAAQPAGGGNGQAPPPSGAGVGEPDHREAGLDTRATQRSAGRSSRWWWLGITCLGGAVATFTFRRNRRRQRLPHDAVGLHVPNAAAGEKEQSVEEIWAAANLLGEAVGRLRQRVASTEGTPASDEIVVVEDESEPPPVVAVPPAPVPTTRNPDAGIETLETIVAHAAGAVGERQVLSALAAEPRVLRRPAPMLRRVDGGLEIRFHVLPGTPLGERSRLLVRLQDAIRAARSEPAN